MTMPIINKATSTAVEIIANSNEYGIVLLQKWSAKNTNISTKNRGINETKDHKNFTNPLIYKSSFVLI